MHRIIPYIILLLFLNTDTALAIRCSNDLITEGESKFEVMLTLKKCGSVLEKEVIRSSDTQKKIDKWLIRVLELGGHYCYELTFADAKLVAIDLLERCE